MVRKHVPHHFHLAQNWMTHQDISRHEGWRLHHPTIIKQNYNLYIKIFTWSIYEIIHICKICLNLLAKIYCDDHSSLQIYLRYKFITILQNHLKSIVFVYFCNFESKSKLTVSLSYLASSLASRGAVIRLEKAQVNTSWPIDVLEDQHVLWKLVPWDCLLILLELLALIQILHFTENSYFYWHVQPCVKSFVLCNWKEYSCLCCQLSQNMCTSFCYKIGWPTPMGSW